jgi:Protein of unknown function (DUF4038)/Putative collagen-binding domain of a collagenase
MTLMRQTFLPLAAIALAMAAGTVVTTAAPTSGPTEEWNTQNAPTFPVKVSANHRYLVDNNGVPFLIVGDSPQTLTVNTSAGDAAGYIKNRQRYGINSLWINILCNWPKVCREDGSTFDGIAPFLRKDDLATPNPEYFSRVDEIIRLAAGSGIVAFLDPIETSGWLNILRANSLAKAFAYGQFLGSRYREFPNIVWMNGNDFQTWRDSTDDALVQAVARGIRSADPTHLQTIELNFLTSGSLDDPSWAPLIDLDAAYTYFPTYAQVLTEYNRPSYKPVFMVEAAYEFENLDNTDGGSTKNLRKQEYWSMLSGAAGQLYGSAATWRLEPGWQSRLDTPGAMQLHYVKELFAPRKWFELVPDQTHSILISGYGSMSERAGNFAAYMGVGPRHGFGLFEFVKNKTGWGSVTYNDYAPAAATADGSLVIAYIPSIRPLVMDMSKLRGPVRARWYDPTNGSYHEVAGSPFAAADAREFDPPGINAEGDGDWILLLERTSDR